MTPFLFWTFALVMLGFGVSVVLQPNPVSSALSLVVSFLGLAALFVSLDAFLLGIMQVLVYAGAVMVLFLFIIMLLDLKAERLRRAGVGVILGGLLVAILFIGQLVYVLHRLPGGDLGAPALGGPVSGARSDVRLVGMAIFTDYNLPLQIVGVLVLVSTVGVIVLSKRELR